MVIDRFKSWRKQKEEGVECPLCGMNSPEGTAECPRCYYQLEKGILEQEDHDVTEEADGLFDELNSDDVEEEEEEELVDWTAHSFGVDDVTIEVSQYDDTDIVNIDAAPGFATYGKQPELADHPEPTDDDPTDWELNPGDAPEEVERFVVPKQQEEQPDEDIIDFKVDLVVPLLPKQAEGGEDVVDDDSAPLQDPSAVPDEIDEEPVEQQSGSTTSTAVVSVTEVSPASETETVEPVQPEPSPSSLPPLPTRPTEANNGAVAAMPKLPSLPGAGEAPVSPAVPTLPSQPTAAPSADAFEEKPETQETAADAAESSEQTAASDAPPVSDRLWPWPQTDAWDDLAVRRALREVMEQVKSGSLDEAARALDKLGPHIGDRVELIFHVGVVLKKLERENALARMLEAGQRLHPDDENVANAVNSLGL